ncbi:hypothetical protein Salat_2510200 [Sesamum alatum]|uniref:Uncharacterized protein n=1 Tax=Sesamum alatum TaxID=300844 RepID=A0AAE1XSM9_9LAMI|nr:hypothetical protein Salat_2510200 [Sesamum alatum]
MQRRLLSQLKYLMAKYSMAKNGGSAIGQQLPYRCAPQAILPPVPTYGYQQQFIPGVRPFRTVMPNFMLLRGNAYNHILGYGLSNVSGQGTTTTTGMFSFAPENNYWPMHEMSCHGSVTVSALASTLANALPSEQITMLGERLYSLVKEVEHEMTAEGHAPENGSNKGFALVGVTRIS